MLKFIFFAVAILFDLTTALGTGASQKPEIVVGIMDSRPWGWQDPQTGKIEGMYMDILYWLEQHFPEFSFKPRLVPYIRLTMGMVDAEKLQLVFRIENPELEQCCVKVFVAVSAIATVAKKRSKHPGKERTGVQIGQEALFKKYAPAGTEPSPVGTYDQLWQMLEADRIEKILGIEATMLASLSKWKTLKHSDLEFELLGQTPTYFYIRKDSGIAAPIYLERLKRVLCDDAKQQPAKDTGIFAMLQRHIPDFYRSLGYKESLAEYGRICPR